MLGTCDLDQIEMRVMADYCRDERLVKLFVDGKDIHAQTASDMFGIPLSKVDPMKHRYPAKRVGFGIITGIQDQGLLDQMHLAGIYDYSLQDCGRMIYDLKTRIYPGIGRFMKECRLEAQRNGYVRDRAGRLRDLPGVKSPWEWMQEEALRASHSHKIQGTAAWVIKRAMKRLWDRYRSGNRAADCYFEPLLQIYDEIIVEYRYSVAIAHLRMEQLLVGIMTADSNLFCVPLKAKFASGPDWGALEK